MRRLIIFGIICIGLFGLLTTLATGQQFTFTGVYAEAIQYANLRAAIGTDTEVVGEISAGTRYPVIAQSALYPWLLLGDAVNAQPFGWVYKDIVTVYGDLNVVPYTEESLSSLGAVITTATQTPAGLGEISPTVGDVIPTTSPTPQPEFKVMGRASGEINIRYTPGVDGERVGVAQAGDVFEIVGYHTQLPWVQVVFTSTPNGYAWIARDLLEIEGDIFSTRAISTTNFSNLPTLTPTSPVLGASSVVREGTPVPVSAEFEGLGNQLWNIVLEAGFDPQTSQFGALYLQDLQTGQEIMFGNDVAFSGTSITKVAILVELFAVLNGDPDPMLAGDIANTMICSENVATNNLLSVIGAGDVYVGSEAVSTFLNTIGLQNTFLTAPYEIPNATAVPPTQPIRYPDTQADQSKANPNITNQMTVDEMGYLLSTIYQCAFNESGPLIANFSTGTYTPQECRKMLHVMANNNVDALLKAGVPADVTVAHKHGWVDDTHGNAAVFFTPGGDYVLVMMLHKPIWLEFEGESLPVFAEVSRTVYNWYNPETPMDAIRDGFIPDAPTCQYRGTPLVYDLTNPAYGIEAPEFTGDIIEIGTP